MYRTGVEQNPLLRAGLVGHWVGGGAGLTWFDRSGKGNHGTLVGGPTWTVGKGSKRAALSFDGVDDYVKTTLTTHYTQTSLSLWVKANSGGEGNLGRIIDKRDAGAQVLLLYLDGTNSMLRFDRIWSGGAGAWSISSSNIIGSGWRHLVVTYDESSDVNDPAFYVDGQQATLIDDIAPVGTPNTNTDGYIIGNRTAGDRTFNGIIDDVRIYNRVLSRAEAALLAGRTLRIQPQKRQVARLSTVPKSLLMLPHAQRFGPFLVR